MPFPALTLGACALLVATGCRREELATGVNDSTFVTAMAGLRAVDARLETDSAHRAAARDSVLRARGLSVAQLEAAARALGDDPERAAAVWQAIDQRVSAATPTTARPRAQKAAPQTAPGAAPHVAPPSIPKGTPPKPTSERASRAPRPRSPS